MVHKKERSSQKSRAAWWRIGSPFNNPAEKHWLMEFSLVMLVSLIIGVVGGLAAIAFRYIVDWGWLGLHIGLDRTIGSTQHGYWIILLPAIGLLLVSFITKYLVSEAKGDGVTQALAAISFKDGRLQSRVGFWSSIASALTLGSGGSAGREGPIALIGATFGSVIGQLLRIPPHYRVLFLGCGAAAGIAATFNAPIAGAFFGIELILGSYAAGVIVPVFLASVMSVVVFIHFMGPEAVLQTPAYDNVNFSCILFMIGLGIITAIGGYFFIYGLHYFKEKIEGVVIPFYLKAFLGGLVVGAIGYFFPQILSVGYPTLHDAMLGKFTIEMLLFLFVAKYLATIITLASGGSGGAFAPTLFLGGVLGGIYGHFLQAIFPSLVITPQIYAIAGMGALFAAASKAPMVAMTMLLEVTGDYQLTAPVIAATVTSYFLFAMLSRDSMYTMGLPLSKIAIPHEPHQHPFSEKLHTICRPKKSRLKVVS